METFAKTLGNERNTRTGRCVDSLKDNGFGCMEDFFSGGVNLGAASYLILTAEVVSDLHVNGF